MVSPTITAYGIKELAEQTRFALKRIDRRFRVGVEDCHQWDEERDIFAMYLYRETQKCKVSGFKFFVAINKKTEYKEIFSYDSKGNLIDIVKADDIWKANRKWVQLIMKLVPVMDWSDRVDRIDPWL